METVSLIAFPSEEISFMKAHPLFQVWWSEECPALLERMRSPSDLCSCLLRRCSAKRKYVYFEIGLSTVAPLRRVWFCMWSRFVTAHRFRNGRSSRLILDAQQLKSALCVSGCFWIFTKEKTLQKPLFCFLCRGAGSKHWWRLPLPQGSNWKGEVLKIKPKFCQNYWSIVQKIMIRKMATFTTLFQPHQNWIVDHFILRKDCFRVSSTHNNLVLKNQKSVQLHLDILDAWRLNGQLLWPETEALLRCVRSAHPLNRQSQHQTKITLGSGT